MIAICLTAITTAFIIGERIDRTVFLKLDVKDPEKLTVQLKLLAEQGVGFGEKCYSRRLIQIEDIPEIAKEYIKSNLELLYKTKIVAEEGILEEFIAEALENRK